MARVSWFGDRILAKALSASVAAVEETTQDAAQHAKTDHRWRDRNGALENAIDTLPVKVEGLFVKGEWGVEAGERVPYWADLEFGTVHMTARPFLRPAADATNPQLAGRLRRNFLA